MKIAAAALALAAFFALPDPIIIRHDVPDREYLALAAKLPVTPAVVRYSSTDVAGTYIAPDWLLSAAHVAETIEPGRKLISLSGDSVEVADIVLHPGWIEDGRPHDIALIQLRRPVADAVVVEIYEDRNEAGKEVIMIGNGDFGIGRTGPAGNDGKLRGATNLIDEVTHDYLVWGFDDPGGGSGRAMPLEGISGPGDSGGPAFIQVGDRYFLAGISSGQSTSATGGKEELYGVTEYYSRASTYADWIRSIVTD